MYIKCGLLERLRWGLQILVKLSVPNDHLEYYNDLLEAKEMIEVILRGPFFISFLKLKDFAKLKFSSY